MENLLKAKSNVSPEINIGQIKNSINSSIQNLTTMKKKISLIVVAIVASTIVAFGQGATPGSAPRNLENCESSPLTPIAGVPYEYSAGVDPAGGTAFWLATFNNTNFITQGGLTTNTLEIGGDFISAADNYKNDNPGAASSTTTTITWNSLGLAQIDNDNPLFVAINYTAEPGSGCANNFKAYRINPINAFLVNILNLDSPGYDELVESCFSDIESAEYDLANNIMNYDFGRNLLAFEVVAANFTDFYNVSFRIEGLENDQNANIYWSYLNDFEEAEMIEDGPFGNEIVPGPTVITTETSTGNGVSIYVWLEVNNNNFEGLNDTSISLAVAGENSANVSNIRWDDCNIPVALSANFGEINAPDYATHILKARPTVTPGGGLNFENQTQP